jgi:hypothetical protein
MGVQQLRMFLSANGQYKSFTSVYVTEAPAKYNFHINNIPGLLGKQKLRDTLSFLVYRENNATAKN